MNFKRALIAILSGVALAAAVPGLQKPYPATTSVIDGLKTVMNPAVPRDGRFAAVLTEEQSWGGEGGPDEAILNRPRDLQVDGQGRVFVIDFGDGTIKAYDGQGRFLRTIGRKGQGPGEFDTPAYFGVLSDGRICLLDYLQHRLTVFSPEGQYQSSFPVEGIFRALAVDGRNRLYLAKWGQKGEPRLSAEFREVPYVTEILRTDAAGKEWMTLTEFQGENMIMKAIGEGGVVMAGGLYTIVWGVDRNGRIIGGYNETYRAVVHGPDGKPEFAFGREYEFLKNPKYSGAVGQKKTLPAFTRAIIFDEQGNFWLELAKNAETKGFTYDVFSPEGLFLKQVAIDQRVRQFAGGRIYCLVETEEGFNLVKRYRMELKPESVS